MVFTYEEQKFVVKFCFYGIEWVLEDLYLKKTYIDTDLIIAHLKSQWREENKMGETLIIWSDSWWHTNKLRLTRGVIAEFQVKKIQRHQNKKFPKKSMWPQVRKTIKFNIEHSLSTCVWTGYGLKKFTKIWWYATVIKNWVACFKREQFSFQDDESLW